MLYVWQTFLGGKLAINMLDACPKRKSNGMGSADAGSPEVCPNFLG